MKGKQGEGKVGKVKCGERIREAEEYDEKRSDE